MTLIETYKGVEIHHDEGKDMFITDLVINIKVKDKNKREYAQNMRLQALRDQIDKILNASTKKPAMDKVLIRGKYSSDKGYSKGTIIYKNEITGEVMVKFDDGKTENFEPNGYTGKKTYERLFLASAENIAQAKIVEGLESDREKINDKISCATKKMIPVRVTAFQ